MRADAQGTPEPPRTLRLVAVASLAILLADLGLPPSVPAAVLYVVPVGISLWSARPRLTRAVALACAALTLAGLFSDPPPLGLALAHRAVALFAIGATAALGRWRAHSEARVRESREALATTLESIGDAVVTTDAQGRVDSVNGAAASLLGWPSEEARGRDETEVFRVVGRSRTSDAQATEAGEANEPGGFGDELPQRRETRIERRDGSRLFVEVTRTPIGPSGVDGESASGHVLVIRDIDARKAHEADMQRRAYRDALTGLHNRASFEDRLELEVAHARRRSDGALALLFLDLDRFKQVNDTHGHATGDELLRQVAARLDSALREADTVARLGGDEFTVVLPDVGSAENAHAVAHKLTQLLSQPYYVGELELISTPSVGVAMFPDDGLSSEALLHKADTEMYRIKRGEPSGAASRPYTSNPSAESAAGLAP